MSEKMQAAIRNLALVVDELVNLSHVLQGDAVQNYQALLEDYENQIHRRSFVRSCWAYVEAVTFSVKQYTFSVCQMGTVNISQDDHAFLGDMLVVVDVEGNIQIQRDPTKPWQTLKERLDYLQKPLAWIGNRISAPRDGRISVILCKYVIG